MKRILLLIFFPILILTGCNRVKTMQKSDSIMGTEVTVTVAARSEAEGRTAIDAVLEEIRRLDRMMSLYKDDSEITRVNLSAGKQPVEASPEMIELAETAVDISKRTEGAFDVTIGPLVVLWQMRLKEGSVPSGKEISRVRRLVDYRNIVVDRKASTIFLKKRNMIMDFGGIAKGYAADKAADLLRKRGIDNAIVALAGDIRILGHRPDGSPWRIGVQHPREKDKTLLVLDLSDTYISTSGDYERFTILHRKRYHHIIDPRSGRPSEGVQSATLIGARGTIGDPLTTALFVLGPVKGVQIAQSLGYEVILEDSSGKVIMTDGVKNMISAATHKQP